MCLLLKRKKSKMSNACGLVLVKLTKITACTEHTCMYVHDNISLIPFPFSPFSFLCNTL